MAQFSYRDKIQRQKGLTAVELLVTLLVASLFLASGYILYESVLNRSSQTRQRAEADNLAMDYLRRYEGAVTATCAASTPLNNSSVANVPGLANVRVTVQITCPLSATVPRVTKIVSTVNYGEGSGAAYTRHTMYVSQ